MHPDFCLTPQGEAILEEKEFNLYQMPYEEIKSFDCGLKLFPRFPKQKKLKAYKPLLSEVIKACEQYLLVNHLPSVIYDIEIKSESPEYLISQPPPHDFAEMLASFVLEHQLSDKIIIRSFDPAPLQYLHQHYPAFPLALIVENQLPAETNLRQLGFQPFMYSPDYVLLTKQEMTYLKKQNLLVVPWTVNTIEEMKEMLHLEVDGIITDYPDLFKTMGL
jgi:glycerophosphoryl diester phosphodiesterase